MSEAFPEYEPDIPARRQADADYTIIAHKVGRMATSLEEIKHTLEHQLSADESRWVKLAIERESQSIALRKAIIEKSLTGLVWMVIVGFFLILKDWAVAHGYKP
jgi:hypothetical protein